MATKETKTKADAKFNPAKCDKVAGEISALITGKIAVSRPASIAEGVLIMTLAMGRVLHVLAAVMGINPKTLVKDYCESLTRYIEMGGDSRVEDLAAALRGKGN